MVKRNTPMIYRHGWCADYPDQDSWARKVFQPANGQNEPRWDANLASAPRFMALTGQAGALKDAAERRRLYAEAETILVAEAAIMAPLYHYTNTTCTKLYLRRAYLLVDWSTWTGGR